VAGRKKSEEIVLTSDAVYWCLVVSATNAADQVLGDHISDFYSPNCLEAFIFPPWTVITREQQTANLFGLTEQPISCRVIIHTEESLALDVYVVLVHGLVGQRGAVGVVHFDEDIIVCRVVGVGRRSGESMVQLSLVGCGCTLRPSYWSVHLADSWCQVATTGTTTQQKD